MAVRIGFVGCGGISRWHMGHLAQIRGAKIVACCDVQEERAAGAAQEFGGKAFTDYKRMYDEEPMDAVYVGLPPFAHTDQELLAAEKGLHLFVEKPVALDLKLAKQVQRAVAKAGIISSAGYQDRYLDVIARLQKELAKHQPGLIMGYWMGGMPGVAWWRRKQQSGGQHVEQTTHIFDMARYLFGEIKLVQAVSSKGLMKDVPKYNIEDASAVNLQFKSGLCGTIFSACFLKVGNKGGIDIWCKEAAFEYAERKSVTMKYPGKDPVCYKVAKDVGMEIDKAFIKAVSKQDQSVLKSDYADAVKSLAISLAASESMSTGQAVKV